VRRGRNDRVGYCTVYVLGSSCNYCSTFFTSFWEIMPFTRNGIFFSIRCYRCSCNFSA
jgi:hypothetical protein